VSLKRESPTMGVEENGDDESQVPGGLKLKGVVFIQEV
jgi:hypothetical protein